MIFFTSILLLGITVIFCLWIELKKWYLNRTKLRAYSKLKELPIIGIGGRFIGIDWQDNEASMQTIDKLFYEKEQPFAAWFG